MMRQTKEIVYQVAFWIALITMFCLIVGNLVVGIWNKSLTIQQQQRMLEKEIVCIRSY